MLALTASIGFLIGKLPVEQFMVLTSSAFAFYFSNKGDNSQQYLGK